MDRYITAPFQLGTGLGSGLGVDAYAHGLVRASLRLGNGFLHVAPGAEVSWSHVAFVQRDSDRGIGTDRVRAGFRMAVQWTRP